MIILRGLLFIINCFFFRGDSSSIYDYKLFFGILFLVFIYVVRMGEGRVGSERMFRNEGVGARLDIVDFF